MDTSRTNQNLSFVGGLQDSSGGRRILNANIFSNPNTKKAYNKQIIDSLSEQDRLIYEGLMSGKKLSEISEESGLDYPEMITSMTLLGNMGLINFDPSTMKGFPTLRGSGELASMYNPLYDSKLSAAKNTDAENRFNRNQWEQYIYQIAQRSRKGKEKDEIDPWEYQKGVENNYDNALSILTNAYYGKVANQLAQEGKDKGLTGSDLKEYVERVVRFPQKGDNWAGHYPKIPQSVASQMIAEAWGMAHGAESYISHRITEVTSGQADAVNMWGIDNVTLGNMIAQQGYRGLLVGTSPNDANAYGLSKNGWMMAEKISEFNTAQSAVYARGKTLATYEGKPVYLSSDGRSYTTSDGGKTRVMVPGQDPSIVMIGNNSWRGITNLQGQVVAFRDGNDDMNSSRNIAMSDIARAMELGLITKTSDRKEALADYVAKISNDYAAYERLNGSWMRNEDGTYTSMIGTPGLGERRSMNTGLNLPVNTITGSVDYGVDQNGRPKDGPFVGLSAFAAAQAQGTATMTQNMKAGAAMSNAWSALQNANSPQSVDAASINLGLASLSMTPGFLASLGESWMASNTLQAQTMNRMSSVSQSLAGKWGVAPPAVAGLISSWSIPQQTLMQNTNALSNVFTAAARSGDYSINSGPSEGGGLLGYSSGLPSSLGGTWGRSPGAPAPSSTPVSISSPPVTSAAFGSTINIAGVNYPTIRTANSSAGVSSGASAAGLRGPGPGGSFVGTSTAFGPPGSTINIAGTNYAIGSAATPDSGAYKGMPTTAAPTSSGLGAYGGTVAGAIAGSYSAAANSGVGSPGYNNAINSIINDAPSGGGGIGGGGKIGDGCNAK